MIVCLADHHLCPSPAAGLEEGQTVPEVLDDGADAYIPGIVRRYDREFQVDFTNR